MPKVERFCVFCGEIPKNKNREHVIPQWLIELTGDKKRIVDFGINCETKETIRFDWDNFQAPACTTCNKEYSDFEGIIKGYILRLLNREPLNAEEYDKLLDWFDKVRIGLWVIYYYIQKNPTFIRPKFSINSRVGLKDRMLAVYPINSDMDGLNCFGVETGVFQRSPSCFGLRINNLVFINASSDFVFSKQCGFPYPQEIKLYLDGENRESLILSKFETLREVQHPILDVALPKPAVFLFQPIRIKDPAGDFQSGFIGDFSILDSFIISHSMFPESPAKGKLFNQFQNEVKVIDSLTDLITFQNIDFNESSTVNSMISWVYELQNLIFEKISLEADDKSLKKKEMQYKKMLLDINKELSTYFRSL